MRTRFTISILILCAGAVLGGAVLARGAQNPQGPKPAKEHELLKLDVGRWQAEVTIYGPLGAPPMKETAIEDNRLDFNGLWLITDLKSTGPSQFQGHGMTGYDPAKKKYVSAWCDNMTAPLLVLEGSYDETAKAVSFTGLVPDPASGGKLRSTRNVTTYLDADTRRLESWTKMDDGQEVKGFEILYRRQ